MPHTCASLHSELEDIENKTKQVEELLFEYRVATPEQAEALKNQIESIKQEVDTKLEQYTRHFAEFKREQIEALETLLKLPEQYDHISNALEKSNTLTRLSSGELGITAERSITNTEYTMPSLNTIRQELLKDPERRKQIETKIKQGFTKLLIVPTALRLQDLAQKTQQAINAKQLKKADGTVITANETYVDSGLQDFHFFISPDNHSSPPTPLTHEEYVMKTNGFTVLLVEDETHILTEEHANAKNDRLKAQYPGTPTRKPFVRGTTDSWGDQLNRFNTTDYAYETGRTPWDYFIQQISELYDDNPRLLNADSSGNYTGYHILLGFQKRDRTLLSYAYWSGGQVRLARVDLGNDTSVGGGSSAVSVLKP